MADELRPVAFEQVQNPNAGHYDRPQNEVFPSDIHIDDKDFEDGEGLPSDSIGVDDSDNRSGLHFRTNARIAALDMAMRVQGVDNTNIVTTADNIFEWLTRD